MNENLEQMLIFFEWHYRILKKPWAFALFIIEIIWNIPVEFNPVSRLSEFLFLF